MICKVFHLHSHDWDVSVNPLFYLLLMVSEKVKKCSSLDGDSMNQSKKSVATFPRGITEVKIIEREWGIERCFKTRDGQHHCIPAAFDYWLFR